MSVIGQVKRAHILENIARLRQKPLTGDDRKILAQILPNTIRTAQGQIRGLFLPHFVRRLIKNVSDMPNAETIIAQFREAKLVEAIEQGELVEHLGLDGVYKGMVREQERFWNVCAAQKHIGRMNAGLRSLQEIVLKLGIDPQENRKIATKGIREALGFSGVRVYRVNVGKGTWLHRYSEGEEGISRFEAAGLPPEKSEKSFLGKLLRSEVSTEEIERAKTAGLFEWKFDNEWGYFYIPDRTRCDFVEQAQMEKDEVGDPAQQRRGYGAGFAREILYLVVGGQKDDKVDVYMITNWEKKRALFSDKDRDLELQHAFANLLARANNLARAYQRVNDLAAHDELTGLYNRRSFNEKIENEFARAKRYDRPLSLLLLDIDFFKLVNDSYGHPVGDLVLKKLAEAINGLVRKGVDIVARWGGEEIAIVLPEINGTAGNENAPEIAERIRAEIEKLTIKLTKVDGTEFSITIRVSIGVATYPNNASSHGDLVIAADNALYEAKTNGRNQVFVSKIDLPR